MFVRQLAGLIIVVALIGVGSAAFWIVVRNETPVERWADQCIQERADRAKSLETFRSFNGIANMAPSQQAMNSEIDVLLADSDCGAITPAAIRQVLHDLNRRVP